MADTQTQTRKSTKRQDVTMCTLSAGPNGVVRPGTVLTLSEDDAADMIRRGFAREYDAARDAKAPRGIETAPKTFGDG